MAGKQKDEAQVLKQFRLHAEEMAAAAKAAANKKGGKVTPQLQTSATATAAGVLRPIPLRPPESLLRQAGSTMERVGHANIPWPTPRPRTYLHNETGLRPTNRQTKVLRLPMSACAPADGPSLLMRRYSIGTKTIGEKTPIKEETC